MPLYYFHLKSPTGCETDDLGSEFADAEQAYLGAYQAALDISLELLRNRIDAADNSFEIADAAGRTLWVLPFTEVLRPSGPRRSFGMLHVSIQEHRRRAERLQDELKVGYRRSRSLLEEARSLLAKVR